MPDYSETPHSLVTAFKPKENRKTESALESHFKEMRSDTEKQIGYLQMAADACRDAGYDISKVEKFTLIPFLQKAVETVSDASARYHGDAYKPYDPDMAFPSKGDLVTHMRHECPRNNIPKIVVPVEPEFKFA